MELSAAQSRQTSMPVPHAALSSVTIHCLESTMGRCSPKMRANDRWTLSIIWRHEAGLGCTRLCEGPMGVAAKATSTSARAAVSIGSQLFTRPGEWMVDGSHTCSSSVGNAPRVKPVFRTLGNQFESAHIPKRRPSVPSSPAFSSVPSSFARHLRISSLSTARAPLSWPICAEVKSILLDASTRSATYLLCAYPPQSVHNAGSSTSASGTGVRPGGTGDGMLVGGAAVKGAAPSLTVVSAVPSQFRAVKKVEVKRRRIPHTDRASARTLPTLGSKAACGRLRLVLWTLWTATEIVARICAVLSAATGIRERQY
ncbi:hypothetical protein GGG16DRAFT_113477 [Schizophyllum commune]